MADPNPPTPVPPPAPEPVPHHRPRGYFNQAQLADLGLGEEVHRNALKEPYKTRLATRDIDTAYLDALGGLLTQARTKTTETGQDNDHRHAATLHASGAERELIKQLQGIQAAAKQKHRMLEADGDPAAIFPLDGYLICQRLNPSRGLLIQNADALLAKAKADQLPGYKTDADRKPVADALAAFRTAGSGQSDAQEEAGQDRLSRDELIRRINSRRLAIQHALDALHSYTDDANAPARKCFKLSADRPFNG